MFWCVFMRLSLFVASWLDLCNLMPCSVVCIPLKCIWNEFNVIWRALQFTNTYVDIILCDFSTVGQTSPHWLQPPRHCIYFDFILISNNICVCVCWFALWRCMFEMCRLPNSDMAAANLRFGSCQTLVDSGLAAAKLGFGNCHTLIYSGLAAAKLRQVPNQSLGNEKLSSLMLLC